MAIVDDACKGNDDPDTSCTGFRKREAPLSLVPACRDNNQTVNATSMCYDPANQTVGGSTRRPDRRQLVPSELCQSAR